MRVHTLVPVWYVELYPEYRPHYGPFGFGYGIYVRVSILYTQKGQICIERVPSREGIERGMIETPSNTFDGK